MNTGAKCIVFDTWAGRRYYAVEVAGETGKKARVRVLDEAIKSIQHRWVRRVAADHEFTSMES